MKLHGISGIIDVLGKKGTVLKIVQRMVHKYRKLRLQGKIRFPQVKSKYDLPDSVMLPVVCGALLSVPQKARGPDRQIIHIRLIYPERKVPDSGSQFGIAGGQADIFFLVLSLFGKNHPRLLLIRFLHCRIRIKNTNPRIVTVKCIRCFCLGKILSGHGKIRFFDIGISFPDQCGFACGNLVFECIGTVILM